MKTLKYTAKILTLISAGKKLEAITEAKDLYGLSLQEAKNMVNSYRPGGNNYYTFFDFDSKPKSDTEAPSNNYSDKNTYSETAQIKCPKCGHEFNVVPEDLDKINLHYECPSCKEDILVDFFDYCPTCKIKVGFLEGGAFKNDMLNIGTTIAKGLFNPFSAVGTIGGMIYESVVNDSKNSIGNGICPYCNLRFIRCYSCHELTPIPSNATFKDTFKCRSCGVYLNPNASVGDVGDLHSKAFINENNKENMTTNIIPKGYVLQGYCSDGTPVYGHDEFTDKAFRMTVYDVIYVNTDNGEICILTGCIEDGCIHPDDKIYLNGRNSVYFTTIIGIELHRKFVPYAEKGDNVGIIISSDFKDRVFKGMTVSSDKLVSSSKEKPTDAEQEYLNGIREFLEDDAEITPRERKMLDRIRQKLGISEERAKELEASLSKPQLTDNEQEYLDELRETFEDVAEITPRERKLLDRHRQKLGISEERAKELEKMV